MKKRIHGVTLVELMVTLVVLAILIGISLPSLRTTIGNNNVSAMTNRIISNLNFARSKAVSSNSTVIIRTGSEAAGNGTNWSAGWTIYSPSNGTNVNSNYVAGTDTLLKTVVPNTTTINIVSNNNQFLSYKPNGMLAAGGNTIITVCYEDTSSSIDGRKIEISTVGRATITTIDAGNTASDCL